MIFSFLFLFALRAAAAASSPQLYCYCWLQQNTNPRISFQYDVTNCDQCIAQGTAAQAGCSNQTSVDVPLLVGDAGPTVGAVCASVQADAPAWSGTFSVNSGATPFVATLPSVEVCDVKSCCCPKGEFVLTGVTADAASGTNVLNGTAQLEGSACGNVTHWAGPVTLMFNRTSFLVVKSSWPFGVNTLVRSGEQIFVTGHLAQCSFLLSPPAGNGGTVAAVVIILIILVLAAGGGYWYWRRRRQTQFNKV